MRVLGRADVLIFFFFFYIQRKCFTATALYTCVDLPFSREPGGWGGRKAQSESLYAHTMSK